MKYIDYSRSLYDALQNIDLSGFSVKLEDDLDSFLDSVSDTITGEQLRASYRTEIDRILDDKLAFFRADIQLLRKVKEVSFYEESIAAYTAFFLFWVWHNGIAFSEQELSKLCESVFMGTIGYRLIDIHNDTSALGAEVIVLGNYMRHLHEMLLADVFDAQESLVVLDKYISQYSQVEYLEKRHRWQTCPFNWERPEDIGLKTAPLFSVFELVFRRSGLSSQEIDDLVRALIYSAAGIQMMDDISDSYEDLSAGIETLVMSGFYEWNRGDEITKELIRDFIDQDRLHLFYTTTQELFHRAREVFSRADDEILLLFLEIQNYRFNSRIEFVDN